MPIADSEIGKGTKIRHPELVNLYSCKVGKDCSIAAFVEIGKNVVIGDRVRIGSYTFIPGGVTIEDDAWIGPRVTFTNDKVPPSAGREWRKTLVKKHACIGAAVTILPGVIINEGCLVGAGAVVTKDVGPGKVVVGVPARCMDQPMQTYRIAPPKIVHKGKKLPRCGKEPEKLCDFCILTPTFNRSKQLEVVVGQLQAEAEAEKFTVVHCIVDDGSDQRLHPYEALVKKWAKPEYHFVFERNFKNFGKSCFWKTWNVLLRLAKEEKWQYAISIQDDHTLCANFLFRVRKHFEELFKKKDKIAVAMNILVQAERNWQRNRFVDGMFICKRKFFDCLGWKLRSIVDIGLDCCGARERQRQSMHPLSSGVGRQMTDRLAVDQRWRIARVRNVSFLTPMETQSVMFPPEEFPNRPKNWGLSRSNFIDNKNRTSAFPKEATR